MDGDPLDDLIVNNSNEANRQQLADAIRNYIQIFHYENKVEIALTDDGEKLTARQKILAFLAGRKAAALKGLIEKEGIAPKDIESQTGILGGTLRPLLGKLRDERLVVNDPDGGYLIPNFAVKKLQSELTKS